MLTSLVYSDGSSHDRSRGRVGFGQLGLELGNPFWGDYFGLVIGTPMVSMRQAFFDFFESGPQRVLFGGSNLFF